MVKEEVLPAVGKVECEVALAAALAALAAVVASGKATVAMAATAAASSALVGEAMGPWCHTLDLGLAANQGCATQT